MTLRLETRTRLCVLAALALTACEARADETVAAGDAGKSALVSLPNDVITDWNDHTIAAIVTSDGYADPLAASRTLALVHLAMHDAVNASAQRIYRPYTVQERDRGAHPIAAAASAAHRVLTGLYEAQASDLCIWTAKVISVRG